MSMIEFQQASKRFGANVVLHPLDLAIERGEVAVIVGPSGSGKSTMLRCINGLEQIQAGTVVVPFEAEADSRRVTGIDGALFGLSVGVSQLR